MYTGTISVIYGPMVYMLIYLVFWQNQWINEIGQEIHDIREKVCCFELF